MTAPPLQPDDPAAVGPYRLLGRLGAGGQGVVYLAQAPDGRRVAVKVLQDGLTGDHRFAKEIDAARRVEPFCVAQVLDASLGGRPYIVTEYVEGPTLRQAGRHAGADLQRLAVATATALAAIHRAGVVHRDFKPANVLLGRDGPRVIDFGIARTAGQSLTVTSSVVGTPAYMAPEQLAGAPVGPEADVFAWASVIVFAATGSPPFGDDSLPAVIRRILHDEPFLGDLPAPLRPVVLACLAKDPSARPAMQDVLLWLIGSRPAPPASPAPGPHPRPHPAAAGHADAQLAAGGHPPPHLTAGGHPPPQLTAGGYAPAPLAAGRHDGAATRGVNRRPGRAILAGAGALAVSAALVAGAIIWMPAPATTASPARPSGATASVNATTGTKTPTATAGTKDGTATTTGSTPAVRPKTTPTGRKPTPRPTSRTPKPTTAKPTTAEPTTPAPTASRQRATPTRSATAAASGGVRLVSLTLDGLKTEKGCWSPSLFPVAVLQGPSGKLTEYGYRWIVDGQDEGWKTDWVKGTAKNQRNPFGAFEPGRHTVVFRLLTPTKAAKSTSFTVCERYS
ncbi:serine/threonine-protein kinase [Nonomuraea rhodomycinica]|uniref:Protein kinase n=1 Tax=Nonomuraea rhodomycinica TaxID=1712872 RepID=A0A7Y6IJN0_9ACTN|nr:serine/threonine-protein kinase [Nonomuraea rhodomycinica]NUW39358.1 protein kinase [Nonomuraea rhodomycinica]